VLPDFTFYGYLINQLSLQLTIVSPFDFVAVIFSLIIGLGLAHLLGAIARLVEERERVALNWRTCLWAATVFLFLVAAWWGLWPMREARSWSYSSFLLMVVYQSALYLMSTLVLPSSVGEEAVDLEAHFARIRSIFLLALAVVSVFAFLVNSSLFGISVFSAFAILPLTGAVAALSGIKFAGKAYQSFLSVFFFVGVVAMTLLDQTVLK